MDIPTKYHAALILNVLLAAAVMGQGPLKTTDVVQLSLPVYDWQKTSAQQWQHIDWATDPCERSFIVPEFAPGMSPKLKGGVWSETEYNLSGSDTVWKRYTISKLEIKAGESANITDSILWKERYQYAKAWTVDRYIIENGEALLQGAQYQFDEMGHPIRELHCRTGEKKCHNWRLFKYHPNDSIWSAGWFHDHHKDSIHMSWYDNGQLRSVLNWNEGRLVSVNCLLDMYGNPLPKGDFNNGNGSVNVYSMNATLIAVYRFKKGKRVSRKKVKRENAPETSD